MEEMTKAVEKVLYSFQSQIIRRFNGYFTHIGDDTICVSYRYKDDHPKIKFIRAARCLKVKPAGLNSSEKADLQDTVYRYNLIVNEINILRKSLAEFMLGKDISDEKILP